MTIAKNKPLWKVALSAVSIILTVIVLIAAGLVALAYLLFSPSQTTLIVWSPGQTMGVLKSYVDGGRLATVSVLGAGQSTDQARKILSLRVPEGQGEEGATVGWDGERHLTLGWPLGVKQVNGPTRVGDLDISYISYDPVLTNVPQSKRRQIQLRDVSVNFKEENGHWGKARYKTGEPVLETKCVIEINGTDSEVFDKVTVRFTGNGVGRSSDGRSISGTVGVQVALTPLAKAGYPAQTPTQMQVGSIIAREATTSAPSQETWRLSYGGYGKNEALKLFSEISGGTFEILVALNFGSQILDYQVERLVVPDKVSEGFNACSANTNIYGTPFSLPR